MRLLEEHAEMTEHLDDVMSAIDAPDHREPDPRAGRQRYFRRGGPMAWVRVITEFVGDEDRIYSDGVPPVQRSFARALTM